MCEGVEWTAGHGGIKKRRHSANSPPIHPASGARKGRATQSGLTNIINRVDRAQNIIIESLNGMLLCSTMGNKDHAK
jgi:hypothetical protein